MAMRAHNLSETPETGRLSVLPRAVRQKVILGKQAGNFRYWPTELLATHILAAKKEISQKRLPLIKKYCSLQTTASPHMVEQANLFEVFSEEHCEETACFNNLIVPYIRALSLAHHALTPLNIPSFESIHSFLPVLKEKTEKRQQAFARLFDNIVSGKATAQHKAPAKSFTTTLCPIKTELEHITALEMEILYPRVMEMENTVIRSGSAAEKTKNIP